MTPKPARPAGATTFPTRDWWTRGLALHERLAGRPRPPTGGAERARRRLAGWRDGYGPGVFGSWLADAGLDENGLLALLAESPADLAARTHRPAWVGTAERAVRATVSHAGELPEGSWLEAFAVPLNGFVTVARDDLVDRAGDVADGAELAAVADRFAGWLATRLATIAARTLVLELNLQRVRGTLVGTDGRQRFAHFVRALSDPAELGRLLAKYPVLGRLLGDATRHAVDAHVELLARHAQDRGAIVDTLLGGTDPGPVVAVDAGRGDAHRRGRTVAFVTYADGRRVVYKPRSLETDDRFAELVGWLNRALPRMDLAAVTTLARDGYGWQEFVEYRELSSLRDAERFYRRQGVLLALLHAVHASDVHCENLIARGDQPVLVDVETLFHPTVGQPVADPATRALAASVHRTALLPYVVVGENGALDVSGLGGERGKVAPTSVVDYEFASTDRMRLTRCSTTFEGRQNRPRLDGREIDPAQHSESVVEGFWLGYDAIAQRSREFRVLLMACAGTETRMIVRPTRQYATLLNESTHPDVLRDALDRDQVLNSLWATAPADSARELTRYEIADLWAGDVPFFTGRPDSRNAWTSTGRQVRDVLPTTGLRCAINKITAVDEADRRDQEWVISATLATLRQAPGHRDAPPPASPVAGRVAEPRMLLTAACGIADQIVARGATDGRRVNWLGLELVDGVRWMLLPMGAGLADGYIGVALFLAQLAQLTNVSRYRDAARRAVSEVMPTLDGLRQRPDLVAAVGCGGYNGFGGIAYGLARLANLLGDGALRAQAEAAVDLAAGAANDDGGDRPTAGRHGVASGAAGCAAAMTAVHAELGLDSAAKLARACGDRLAELVERTGGRCATGGDPDRTSFAHGSAGIGWALARLATRHGAGSRYEPAARAALSRGGGLAQRRVPGWCAGTAGLVAARATAGTLTVPGRRRAVRTLTANPLPRDLSPCHGELGIAEALVVLAEREASQAARHRAGQILDAIARHGPYCGSPDGVATPGLLSGLSGIGYGLLRLGFAERVPSALLLEPAVDRPGHGPLK